MANTEAHNVEWKQSWRDEYLKWICGFANADGGTLYIGKDDNGQTVGVADAKRLLEDIPNKIVTHLGIVCDVRLLREPAGEVIEISVDRSPYPVNYRGEFHYRSGATKQVLSGNQLTRFIFDRTGLSWEAVPVDGVDSDDLWRESFSIFKSHALASHRMSQEELSCPDSQLLDKLELVKDGRLTRAGVLLFSHFPEKHVSQCYTRIALFENDADIRFEDEVHGSLLEQAERVVELLYQKYLVAPVSYDWMTRVERYAFHPDSVRELVYNALIHSNWARGIPIQIKVMPDRLYISNVAVPPRDLTVEKLLGEHRSEPYNPLIAKTFYRAGLIESWGRGIDKVRRGCEANGNPMATFMLEDSGLMVRLDLPDWWPEDLAVFGGLRRGGEAVGADSPSVLIPPEKRVGGAGVSTANEKPVSISGEPSEADGVGDKHDDMGSDRLACGDKSATEAGESSSKTDGAPMGTDGHRWGTDGAPVDTDGTELDTRTLAILSLFETSGEIATSDVGRVLGLGMDRSKEIVRDLVKRGVLTKHGNGRYTRYTLAKGE